MTAGKIGRQGMVSHVAASGKMRYARDVHQDPYYIACEPAARSEVDIPLKTDGRLIECPFRYVRQGRAVRLVVGESSLTTDASRKAILKAIARARNWYEQLTTGEAESVAQLASMHDLSPRFINLHLKLIPLSPEWIEKIMTKPSAMPLSLDELLLSIPMKWSEQAVGLASK